MARRADLAPARSWDRRRVGGLGSGAAGRSGRRIVRSAAAARRVGRARRRSEWREWLDRPASAAQSELTFAPVRSSTELDQAVKAAARPAMLDFYADWCVSCKEMEKSHVQRSARAGEISKQMNLLRADVTANNADDQALLKRFGLFGPPGIIFFDHGAMRSLRVVGYESADKFLTHARSGERFGQRLAI